MDLTVVLPLRQQRNANPVLTTHPLLDMALAMDLAR